MKKESILVWKYFVVCFALSTFILLPIGTVRAATTEYRWYVGYDFYGEVRDAPMGVKARVFTISPSIPYDNTMFQLVAVFLSYYPTYWLQLGYLKCNKWYGQHYTFYYEVKDADTIGDKYQYWVWYGPWPITYHTYTYAIWEEQNRYWKLAILEGSTWKWNMDFVTDPHESVDLTARIELTCDNIDIDLSHFSEICYYAPSTPLNWLWWDQYNMPPWSTAPYDIETPQTYEFEGSL